MINTIHRLKGFLKYQQIAKTKYYLHSPFVYQFYLDILEGVQDTEIQNISKFRKKLLHTHDRIVVNDLGADPGQKDRLISSLAAKASIPERYGIVLYRLVKQYKPNSIIELGTCLGLGTAYLAAASPSASVITIEGDATLAQKAVNNFSSLRFNNIEVMQGGFDEVLPMALSKISKVDLAYIDGNHRYEPTMKYFNLLMEKTHEQSILIFDDIHWSKEMTVAWEDIKKDPRITLTIDLYRLGIAFMSKGKLAKEDFVLRY